MATTSKYFVVNTNGDNTNFIDFDLRYGALTTAGESIQYNGSPSKDAVFVRPGLTYDLTNTADANDKIYLFGSLADYTLQADSVNHTLTLTRPSLNESVKVSSGTAQAFDSLIFTNGVANTLELFNAVVNSGTLPTPNASVETSLTPLATSGAGASAILNATINAYAINQNGETFASVRHGINFIVNGSGGVDKVYVADGESVNASNLSGGVDLIYMRGNWADYTKALNTVNNTITFTRIINGLGESITVAIGTLQSPDRVIFADGTVNTANASIALTSSLTAPISGITGYNPAITTPLYNDTQVATALAAIRDAAENNTATDTTPSLVTYITAGVTGVTTGNLAAINSALDSVSVTGSQADTAVNVQAIVNAYAVILAEANDTADTADTAGNSIVDANSAINPTVAQYALIGADIGLAATVATNLNLLNDIVGAKQAVDVDTVAEIDELARIANAIQTVAADGTPSPALTVADLAKIGLNVTSLTPTNLNTVLAAINAKLNTGSDTDSLQKLQAIINNVDTTPPTVTTLAFNGTTGANNGWLNVGDLVSVTVAFNENVFVTGAPQLKLNIGGTLVQADYLSGSGGTTLSFSYAIHVGEGDMDGISIDPNSLSFNAGSIQDSSGNVAVLTHLGMSDANPLNYRVDTTMPAAAVVSTYSGDNNSTVNLAEATAGFTISGTNESGATVTLAGQTVIADTATSWHTLLNTASITGYGQGAESLSVVSTDAAGNTTSTPVNLTVDTLAPSAAVVSTYSGDNNSTVNLAEATASFTISGTNEAGATVTLAGQTVITDTATSWHTVLNAATIIGFGQGAESLSVVSTDAAGNTTSTPVSLFVDTLAPTQTVATAAFSADTGTTGDFITKTAAQTISGTLSAVVTTGDTVYISLDNGSNWTAAATTVGANSFSLAGQSISGSSTLKIKVTDLAGNDGTVFSQNYTLDATAPSAPVLTESGSADLADSLMNNAEAATTTFRATLPTTGSIAAVGDTVQLLLGGSAFGTPKTFTLTSTEIGQGYVDLTVLKADLGLDGSKSLTAQITDVAGNPGTTSTAVSFTLDATTPSAALTTGSGINSGNATVQSTEVGTAYLVKSTVTVTVTDLASITGSGDTNFNSVSIATAGSNTSLSLAGLVDGSYKLYVVDAAGNLSTAAGTTYTVTSGPVPGDPVIDLGSGNGKLIAPVQVEGKWYYHWDRLGDGTNGTLDYRNPEDYFTHDVLDSIFRYDISGNLNPGTGTTNTYRYVTLNGVKVALPTYGAGITSYGIAFPVGVYKTGTDVANNTTTDNPTYNDLLAIWDSQNGTGTSTSSRGVPTGWWGDYYSATPSPSGYAAVTLAVGGASYDYDGTDGAGGIVGLTVALQVLDKVAPVFTSAATASVAENTATSVVVYDAQASDNQGANVTDNLVTYTLSGLDAARFTINATNGQVQFAAVPVYSSPVDVGANNVYDINVIATDVDNNTSTQAVAITVTDIVAPTVSSVVISASGASGTLLNAGDVVTVTATYSEAVTGQPTTAPTLTIGTETGITLTASTTTGNTRTWTYTIANTGTTDTGSISVVGNLVTGITDAASNAATGSTPAATGSFTADTAAPTAVISNYTDNAATGSTGNFASGTTTDDTTPVLNGTVTTSPVGTDVVKIYDNSTFLANATVTGSSWTYATPTLLDGSKHSYTAIATDLAGNTGVASSAFTLAVSSNSTNASAPYERLTNAPIEVDATGWTLNSTDGGIIYHNASQQNQGGIIYYNGAANTAGGIASQTMSNLIVGQTYTVQYEASTIFDTARNDMQTTVYDGVMSFSGSSWTGGTSLGTQTKSYTSLTSVINSFDFIATSTTATVVFRNTYAADTAQTGFALRQASVTTADEVARHAATPLILDLNGDGVQTVGVDQGVLFDVANTGILARTAWANVNDGILVRDLNHDGAINNGAELFGNGTLLVDGSCAANGFDALAQFDSNHDGQIDVQDAVFQELQVWRDANGDGVSQYGELLSLQDAGIASFNLSAAQGNEVHNGNVYGLLSSYTTTDGAVHELTDVWFAQGAKLTLDTDASGLNYLHLATNSPALDLGTIDTSRLQGVNVIDMLSNQTADSLRLDFQQVVDLSLENGAKSTTSGLVGSRNNVAGNETSYQLMLFGDALDTVQIGSGWTNSGTVLNYNGHDLAVYNSSTSAAQLLIEQIIVTTGHLVI